MQLSADRIESLRLLLAKDGFPAMSEEELRLAGLSIMRFVLAKVERTNELINMENAHEQSQPPQTNSN